MSNRTGRFWPTPAPLPWLLLDIRDVALFSSSLINLSIDLWKDVSSRGGKFAILGARGHAAMADEVMPFFWKHDPWFPIYDDEEAAIREMARPV